MKIFLSWSGHKSHQVALVLRDWLPSVIQSVTPYVSSEDIDKGARWSSDIAKELEDSSFGILCVTKENLEAPWLLFEAGALSKMMDKSSVCPFLFDLKMTEIKEGPILQFQTTSYEKEDLKKLLITLNKSCGDVGLKEELLNKSFEVWWPNLKESLDKILEEKDEEKSASQKTNKYDMLEEILELTRINQKILRSPDILFPSGYFEGIIRMNFEKEKLIKDDMRHFYRRIDTRLKQLSDMINQYRRDKKTVDDNMVMYILQIHEDLKQMHSILYM